MDTEDGSHLYTQALYIILTVLRKKGGHESEACGMGWKERGRREWCNYILIKKKVILNIY